MHRRVDVTEIPLVGGNLSVGVRIEVPQHQQKLILGEIEVHQRKGDRMKSQVPRRIPGILPLVGHRNDVAVQHVEPLGIAPALLTRTGEWMSSMRLQPAVEVEIVVLLAPQHSRQGLAVHATFILAQRRWGDPLVEFVGIGQASSKYLVERSEGVGWWFRAQAQPDYLAAAGWDFKTIESRGLRAHLGGIHSIVIACDHIIMKSIFYKWRRIRLAPQATRVGLIFRKQQFWITVALKRAATQLIVRSQYCSLFHLLYLRLECTLVP